MIRCVAGVFSGTCMAYYRMPAGQDVNFYWVPAPNIELVVRSMQRSLEEPFDGVIGRCSGTPFLLNLCGPFYTLPPDPAMECEPRQFGCWDTLWARPEGASGPVGAITIGYDPTPPDNVGPVKQWADGVIATGLQAAEQAKALALATAEQAKALALAKVEEVRAKVSGMQQSPGPLPPGWQERSLVQETVPLGTPALGQSVVVIDGRPATNNPAFYEIRVTVAGQALAPVTVFTGLPLPPQHLDLFGVPAQAGTVELAVMERYDPSQRFSPACIGTFCPVSLPVNPTNPLWITGAGQAAELIVHARLTVNGASAGDQWLRVPILGQLGAANP